MAGERASEGVDLVAVAAWMDRQSLGHGPLTEVRVLTGGTQNILLRFERGGAAYVLRRPPLNLRKDSNESMRREARVLAALAGSGVPHPGLIAACSDETVIGASFYLMEPIDGFNVMNGLPAPHLGSPELRHRMGLSMVEHIARLGSLDHAALGLDGFGKPDGYLERQVPLWLDRLRSYAQIAGWSNPSRLPGVEEVARWLRAKLPTSFSAGIMHGDYHIANVMFRHGSGEVAAIVDWELSTIGDPLMDLGWMLATWPDDATTPVPGFPIVDDLPTRGELVDHYAARSARDLSAIHWYAVMACFKLAIILEGTHARACAGKAPREYGDALHESAIELFRKARHWIDGAPLTPAARAAALPRTIPAPADPRAPSR